MSILPDRLKEHMLYKITGNLEHSADIWSASVAYLNNKGWQLSWQQHQRQWYLYSGENAIFFYEKWDMLQLFVYGLVFSTFNILHMQSFSGSKRSQRTHNVVKAIKKSSLSKVFQELVDVNRHIIEYESRFATPGRASNIYAVYKKNLYESEKAHQYRKFAELYEKKLSLEATLLTLSESGIDHLKFAARNSKPIQLNSSKRLPIILVFLSLYLEKKSMSWYFVDGTWYYFEGDILIFFVNDSESFESFMLGIAYNYAKLSDETIETYIKGF